MYGASMNNTIVAIHDDFNIVKEFIGQQLNSDDFNIVKIKNKKIMRSMSEYEDLYLVICDGQYIPYELYDTMKRESDAGKHDLISCRETLYRIIEDGELSKKEIESIYKTIKLLSDRISEPIDVDYNTLKEIDMLNKQFKDTIV